jgi:hypothetical protein
MSRVVRITNNLEPLRGDRPPQRGFRGPSREDVAYHAAFLLALIFIATVIGWGL